MNLNTVAIIFLWLCTTLTVNTLPVGRFSKASIDLLRNGASVCRRTRIASVVENAESNCDYMLMGYYNADASSVDPSRQKLNVGAGRSDEISLISAPTEAREGRRPSTNFGQTSCSIYAKPSDMSTFASFMVRRNFHSSQPSSGLAGFAHHHHPFTFYDYLHEVAQHSGPKDNEGHHHNVFLELIIPQQHIQKLKASCAGERSDVSHSDSQSWLADEFPLTESISPTMEHQDTMAMPEIKFDTANIVFVLGGPGSGKGTQCANLMNELKFSHISSGDIFRSEVKKGSELGQTLNQIMRDGKMVPLDITKLLLINEMNAQKKASGFLLDGYPRTLEQAKYFEKKIAAPRLVLYYEAPTEVLVGRLLNRAKTSGRVDDNMESIIKRIRTFEETTKPLVDYYESLGILKRIDATRSVDEITRESLDTLDESELTKRS